MWSTPLLWILRGASSSLVHAQIKPGTRCRASTCTWYQGSTGSSMLDTAPDPCAPILNVLKATMMKASIPLLRVSFLRNCYSNCRWREPKTERKRKEREKKPVLRRSDGVKM
ncbi:MAG: hypothetical protein J3Q66DRAFT_342652, partial [Benniella sp.]